MSEICDYGMYVGKDPEKWAAIFKREAPDWPVDLFFVQDFEGKIRRPTKEEPKPDQKSSCKILAVLP